jgi:hypothetical protein
MKKKIEKIKNGIKELSEYVVSLRSKLNNVENAISDEARAEIEGRIGQLESLIADLKEIEAAAAEGTDDKSEEMRTQMREALARLTSLENSIKKGQKVENDVKEAVKSKAFAVKFLEVVKNSANAEEFRENFRELCKKHVKNDINPDSDDLSDFMPPAVLREINDQFVGKRHRLLELVDWTGLPVYKALYETENDMAYQWPDDKNEDGSKVQQNLSLEPIEIRPKYIYKYLTIDKEMERMSRDNSDVLLRYIARELVDRLLTTIEMLIVRAPSGSSFLPPATATITDGEMNALAYMEDVDGAIAIMSAQTYLGVKQTVTSINNRLATYDDVLSYLGVEEIVFTKAVSATPNSAGIWYMRPSDYKIVGDRRPDQYEDFNLAYNRKEYLTEMWIGGGCIVPNNFVELIERR